MMDMDEDNEVPLILGRPFMKTTKVIIDVDDGKLNVKVQDDEVQFNVFEAMKHPKDKGSVLEWMSWMRQFLTLGSLLKEKMG